MNNNSILLHRKFIFTEDSYGNPAPSLLSETEIGALVSWDQVAFTSDLEGVKDEGVIKAFIENHIPLDETDRFVYQGREYRVSGSIRKMQPPLGFALVTRQEVKLALISGVVNG